MEPAMQSTPSPPRPVRPLSPTDAARAIITDPDRAARLDEATRRWCWHLVAAAKRRRADALQSSTAVLQSDSHGDAA
jgi:hypothetical protein